MKELLKIVNNNIADLTKDISQTESNFYENTQQYRDQKYGKSEFHEKYNSKSYYFNLNLFEGKSQLLIPSFSNDYGLRPQTSINYNSTGMKVLKNNYPVSEIDSVSQYTVQCEIQNRGDLSVPAANVEFFVAPRYKLNNLDVSVENTKYKPVRKNGRTSLTSITTVISGEVKKGTLRALDYVNVICDDTIINTRIDKVSIQSFTEVLDVPSANIGDKVILELTTSIQNGNSIQKASRIVGDDPTTKMDRETFRLVVQDIYSITGRGTVVTGIVEKGEVSIGDVVNLTRNGALIESLTSITGFEMFKKKVNKASAGDMVGILFRGVTKDLFKKGDVLTKESKSVDRIVTLPKPEDLADFEFLEKTSIYIPPIGNAIAEFSFDASRFEGKGAIFCCRVFSLMPIDIPDNFDSLDAKINRYVGVYEVQ